MRNHNNTALTNDQLLKIAPSVFTGGAHERTSEKYNHVPTIDVVDTLRAQGWDVYSASQSRVRDGSRQGFQKHILRLRHEDEQNRLTSVGDSVVEAILTNAHDGLSSYRLSTGVFRLVCLNGMVVAEGYAPSVALRHVGINMDDVLDVTQQVIDVAPEIAARISRFRSVELSPVEQREMARQAITSRWEDEAPINAEDLLLSRRYADNGSNLWVVTNRIQENLIRGGIRGRAKTGRRTTTRDVKSIDADLKINKKVWSLAEEIYQLKAA